MPKRICWKKGMRLTDEVLRASDRCFLELANTAFALSAAGRFGLLPVSRPFEVSLDVSNGMIDIISLDCVAITRDGSLIDACYDTRFNNSFDTRVPIPDDISSNELILIISTTEGEWKETHDGYEEPSYVFNLVGPDNPIADNALPIARIVDSEYEGWRIDDLDFVPPCLFVSSHYKFRELLTRFNETLSDIDQKVLSLLQGNNKSVFAVFWPVVEQLMITTEKESDLMTPMMLLSSVQKCVSAFTCACDLEDNLNLENSDALRAYVRRPYSYKNVYSTIKEGLDICFRISENVANLQVTPSTPPPAAPGAPTAPTLNDSELLKRCGSSVVKITVTNNTPGATVHYTIDGSEPTEASKRGAIITIENGFKRARVAEPDKTITIKLKAYKNGMGSQTNTYQVTMIKDISIWDGKVI